MKRKIPGILIICAFLLMPVGSALSETDSNKEEFKRAILKDAVVKDTILTHPVSINFKNAPMTDVVLSLSRQAAKSIIIDKSIDPSKIKITCFYEGSSFDEALDSIVGGLDFTYRALSDGAYIITDYEETIINVHDVYVKHIESLSTTSSRTNNTSLGNSSSGNAGLGGLSSRNGNNGSSNGDEKTTSEHSEREIDRILTHIKAMLSPKGVVTKMSAGFIYVRDIPSRIVMVKKMIKLDDNKRKTILMKITLLRIDYKDEHETGINWWALLKQSTTPRIEMSTNFNGATLGTLTGNVATVTLTQGDLSAVIKALANYGKVNIVQSWETRAVSGAVLPFQLSQSVWYSTGSVVQVVNNNTITTPQMESVEVGLKMTVNPMKMEKGYLVNTSVDLSNVIAFQTIGTLEVPNIERNYVSIPIKMGVGETVAISGFKVKSSDKQRIGIPLLVKIPVLSYLFGYNESKERTSELTVMITFGEEKED